MKYECYNCRKLVTDKKAVWSFDGETTHGYTFYVPRCIPCFKKNKEKVLKSDWTNDYYLWIN